MTKLAVLLLVHHLLPADAEIISDITTSETDEFSALQLKVEQFWKPVLNAAQEVKMDSHVELYADAEAVLRDLPAENTYVRTALSEALDHLKKADDVLLEHALQSSNLAQDKLAEPCDTSSTPFSFLTGGQNFLRTALKRFISGGKYSEKLVEHVGKRQADILPVLRGAASKTGNILSDCRLASKRSFDVRKYDIYNDNVPKTPEDAKAVADRIIDASSETRRHFTKSITDMVTGITKDVQEKHQEASVTVTQASISASLAQAEAKLSAGIHVKTPYIEL